MAYCCDQIKFYSLGQEVVLHTDAQSWQELNLKTPSIVVAGLLERILAVNPRTLWIKGVKNVVADGFTRLLPEDPDNVCLNLGVVGYRWNFGCSV